MSLNKKIQSIIYNTNHVIKKLMRIPFIIKKKVIENNLNIVL